MEPWSRLCCLALVISTAFRGQHGQSVLPDNTAPPTVLPADVRGTASTPPNVETTSDATRSSSPGASSQSPGPTTAAVTSRAGDANVTTQTAVASDNGTQAPPTATVTKEISSASPAGPRGGDETPVWAHVVLVLIILAIIALCVILYFLRRASKTYTFELQRPGPSSGLHQPAGTFEAVYLDDLEPPPMPKDVQTGEEPSSPAATNGTSVQLQGPHDSDHDDDPQVQVNPDDRSPPSDGGSVASGDDPADAATDPSGSVDLLLDPVGPQSNENNNNPVCSSDPFVEISLDDASPWTDQLLSSPQAPSSVLPFSF